MKKDKLKKYISLGLSYSLLTTFGCGTTKLEKTVWEPVKTYENVVEEKQIENLIYNYNFKTPNLEDCLLNGWVSESAEKEIYLEKQIEIKSDLKEIGIYTKEEADIGELAVNTFYGAVWGAAIGVGAGLLFALSVSAEEDTSDSSSSGSSAGAVWAGTAIAGILIGGMIGSLEEDAWSQSTIKKETGNVKTETISRKKERTPIGREILYENQPCDNKKISGKIVCVTNDVYRNVVYSSDWENSIVRNGYFSLKFENLNFSPTENGLKNLSVYEEVKNMYSRLVADKLLESAIPVECSCTLKVGDTKRNFQFSGYTLDSESVNELLK